MRRFLWLSLGALLLAGVAAASSGGASQAEGRWVITDLGTLGKRGSEATAINERVQIVGAVDTRHRNTYGDPLYHAFVWQRGKMRDLGTLGKRESYAYGINERGEIVGWLRIGALKTRAVLWQDGKVRDLGVTVPDSTPLALNTRSQVVGTRADLVPFFWQKGRTRILGGKRGEATAINERGQVVGNTFTVGAAGGAIFHAFLWENGRMRALAGLGGASSSAYDVNEAGQVVGRADLKGHDPENKYEDPIYNAFLWEKGKMRDLGSAASYSVAYGINDRGQIVGSVTALGEDQEEKAVVWQNGKMTELPALPHQEQSRAVAINDRGQIVGWVETAGEGSWRSRAVLWTLKR